MWWSECLVVAERKADLSFPTNEAWFTKTPGLKGGISFFPMTQKDY
jgi:hypothetical protein